MLLVFAAVILSLGSAEPAAPNQVKLYGVHEITLPGPVYGPQDTPLLETDLCTEWRHESGEPSYKVYGFWDGDGKGGNSGSTFKARFCPTKTGKWTLVRTTSNKQELNGEKQGYSITCVRSDHPGFWEVDAEDSGGRWYKRSDGSFPYIFGNTMYSFLSEYNDTGPTGGNIAADIRGNSRYFRKVRFAITGDRYPHPQEKPFLNNSGKPTDNGNFSHRPNAVWFHNRVDLAVREAHKHDLIADLILNGPDTQDSRSVLRASENNEDCTPILKYIAARYGSYPNVWICLSNEFDIKKPKYRPSDIAKFGLKIRKYLPYPTPLSVHARPRDWYRELDTTPPWNDHITLQNKIKKMHTAADFVSRNFLVGGSNKPVIDDELAYEGKGDGWSEADVIEAHVGAFLGGGYGTTGHKPASKKGHYFHGNFKASEHKSADNLLWLRRVIEENVTFWKMAPVGDPEPGDGVVGIFTNLHPEFRAMAWPNHEYVLGTNRTRARIQARLPNGKWQVKRFDIIAKKQKLLSSDATGSFTFDAPASRAVLFHFKKQY
jgi:hypothetical protein